MDKDYLPYDNPEEFYFLQVGKKEFDKTRSRYLQWKYFSARTNLKDYLKKGLKSTAPIEGLQNIMKRSLDELVELNQRYVISIALNIVKQRGLPKGSHLMDLIQEGNFGLINAIEHFDPKRSQFSTYAKVPIQRKIQRYYEDHGRQIRIPVWVYTLRRDIYKQIGRVYTKEGRYPSIEELAKATGIKAKGVKMVLDSFGLKLVHLEEPINSEEDNYHEIVADPRATEQIYKESVLAKIRNLLHDVKLRPRHRNILCLRSGCTGKEYNMAEIGAMPEYNVTREAIRQAQAKAYNIIRSSEQSEQLEEIWEESVLAQ